MNMVWAISEPVPAEPLVARAPDQPPLAVHDVAFVLDQFNVAAVPLATVMGVAVSVTDGGGLGITVTVADWLVVPPLLVQLSAKELVADRGPVLCEPLVAFVPLHAPDAVQIDAPRLLHVSVDEFPTLMLTGVALKASCGGPLDATGRTSIALTQASPATRVKTRLSVPSDVTRNVRSATVLTGTT
jgi:hypothetical protein